MRNVAFWIAVLCLLIPTGTKAQQAGDFEETLSQVGSEYARMYVSPLSEALGANMNSGWFHSARVGSGNKLGLSFDIGFAAFGTLVTSSDQQFDLRYSARVDVPVMIGSQEVTLSIPAEFSVQQAPTVLGSTDAPIASAHVRVDTTFDYLGVRIPISFDSTFTTETVGGLVKTPVLPSAVPQLAIGGILGTELVVRFIPKTDIPEFGGVKLAGVGVRHSISRYIPKSPVDVAVLLSWQHLAVDGVNDLRLLELRTFAANVHVSKSIGILTFYGAVQSERSDIDVAYLFEGNEFEANVDPFVISFSARGANKVRGVTGLSLRAGPVHWNVDVGFGKVTVVSTGLGVGF